MEAIEFNEQTCTIAKDQKPYLALPVCKSKDGEVISCYKLNFKDRLKAMFLGKLWLRQLTFNQLLQPQCPTFDYPFIKEKQ